MGESLNGTGGGLDVTRAKLTETPANLDATRGKPDARAVATDAQAAKLGAQGVASGAQAAKLGAQAVATNATGEKLNGTRSKLSFARSILRDGGTWAGEESRFVCGPFVAWAGDRANGKRAAAVGRIVRAEGRFVGGAQGRAAAHPFRGEEKGREEKREVPRSRGAKPPLATLAHASGMKRGREGMKKGTPRMGKGDSGMKRRGERGEHGGPRRGNSESRAKSADWVE